MGHRLAARVNVRLFFVGTSHVRFWLSDPACWHITAVGRTAGWVAMRPIHPCHGGASTRYSS